MNVSRLRGRPRSLQTYGRAKVGPWTLALLVVLRVYAIVAVVIAVYSFVRAIR